MAEPLHGKTAASSVDEVFQQALSLLAQGKPGEAAQVLRGMIESDPRHASAWLNLGAALRQQRHFQAALLCTKKALDLAPGVPGCTVNYAACLFDLNRGAEALQAYERAVQMEPSSFHTHKSYAIVAAELGEFEKSILHANKALALEPADAYLKWHLATVYLQLGKFHEGWKLFESRLDLPEFGTVKIQASRWKGEDLHGKTLLLIEEQGFGDTILCSRYIPQIKARGARILLKCRKDLHRLFQDIPGIDKISDSGRLAEKVDYFAMMMSLPGIIGTELSSIPSPPALHVPDLPAEARRLLGQSAGKFKVGVIWAGSPQYPLNKKRSAAAEKFLSLAELPGVRLFSLQKGPSANDIAACGGGGIVTELGPCLNDFADTAAVVKELDLVIMTDSAVAHLAGSLNVPVWNLLSYRPYWLYMWDRADCPWYPSMRLFRQPRPGDWDTVFEKARAELEKTAAKKLSLKAS